MTNGSTISINVFLSQGNETKNVPAGSTARDAAQTLGIDAARYVVRLNNKTLVDVVTDPRTEDLWTTTLRAGDDLIASTPRKVTAATL